MCIPELAGYTFLYWKHYFENTISLFFYFYLSLLHIINQTDTHIVLFPIMQKY